MQPLKRQKQAISGKTRQNVDLRSHQSEQGRFGTLATDEAETERSVIVVLTQGNGGNGASAGNKGYIISHVTATRSRPFVRSGGALRRTYPESAAYRTIL